MKNSRNNAQGKGQDIKKGKPGKKKLLLFTGGYYPGNTDTAENMTEIAEGLSETMDVTVISPVSPGQSNRAGGGRLRRYGKEYRNGVAVLCVRAPFFGEKNRIAGWIGSGIFFCCGISAAWKAGKQDYVYAASRPAVLGLLGIVCRWIMKARFIYAVPDFCPEQIEKEQDGSFRGAVRPFPLFHNVICRGADKVVFTARGREEICKRGLDKDKITEYCGIPGLLKENGIIPLQKENPGLMDFKRKYGLEDKYVILFSEKNGGEETLPVLFKVLPCFFHMADVIFAFCGTDDMKHKLEELAGKWPDNMRFIPYHKESNVYCLNAADFHWVVRERSCRGLTVPEQLYEAMAAGKPVLGILEKGSEGCRIIEETECGYTAVPGDYDGIYGMLAHVLFLQQDYGDWGQRGRDYLEKNLTGRSLVTEYRKMLSVLIQKMDAEDV